VLQIHEREAVDAIEPGPCLKLTVSTLTQLFGKGVAVMPELIAQGLVSIEKGTAQELMNFFAFFDPRPTHLPELASR
jgi:hypothetical protein